MRARRLSVPRHLRNSAAITASAAAGAVLTGVTFVLLARIDAPSEFGRIVQAYSVMQFASVLCDFGTSTLATRELTDERMHPRFAARSRLRRRLSLGFLAASLVAMFVAPELVAIGLLVVTGALATAYTRYSLGPLVVVYRMGYASFVTVLDKTVLLAGVVALGLAGEVSPELVLLAAVVGSVVAGGLTERAWPKTMTGLFECGTRSGLRDLYAGARHFGVTSIFVGLGNLDTVVIGATAGAAASGVYGAVSRWTQPMAMVAQAVARSAYVEFVNESSAQHRRHVLRTSLAVVTVAVLPLIAVVVLSDRVVSLLLGPQYAASGPVLSLLALGAICGNFAAPFVVLLQASGRERFISWLYGVALVGQLIAMAILGLTVGATGGAVAVVAAQLAILVGFVVKALPMVRAGAAEPAAAESR